MLLLVNRKKDKSDYLKELGAKNVIDRKEFDRRTKITRIKVYGMGLLIPSLVEKFYLMLFHKLDQME